MGVIILLVILSLSIALIFLFAFFWAVGSGQYDDEITPSIRMLFDNPSNQTPDDEQQPDC